jgi:tRNA G18 (ribose-2'-O)-methylase SpoU
MREGMRSLNLAVAAGIGIYRALGDIAAAARYKMTGG